MNEHYVCIKVDREERPDVDAIYMSAVQALTGSGGWPMSVWLTPEREPFFGGTYFPPRDGARGARHGFLTAAARAARDLQRSDPARVSSARPPLATAVREEHGARARRQRGAPSGAPGVDRSAATVDSLQARVRRRARRRAARAEVPVEPPDPAACCATTAAPATPRRCAWRR